MYCSRGSSRRGANSPPLTYTGRRPASMNARGDVYWNRSGKNYAWAWAESSPRRTSRAAWGVEMNTCVYRSPGRRRERTGTKTLASSAWRRCLGWPDFLETISCRRGKGRDFDGSGEHSELRGRRGRGPAKLLDHRTAPLLRQAIASTAPHHPRTRITTIPLAGPTLDACTSRTRRSRLHWWRRR